MVHTDRDGEILHRQVKPECWCVTAQDLVNLRREVEEAVVSGSICPTSRDPFDPADKLVGPSIYTLNKQYIKPMSLKAGKVSYALMCHPEGLKCDLFVTHSWEEGTFQFIDRVLHSWPRPCKHAYCCMLSNPQCLDISDLIKDPLTSPFALALNAASHALAIPNHHKSIYSRLWCCFEAYLAYVWGKEILTATAPITRASYVKAALPLLWQNCLAFLEVSLLRILLGDAVFCGDEKIGLVKMLVFFPSFAMTILSCLGATFSEPGSRRRFRTLIMAHSVGLMEGFMLHELVILWHTQSEQWHNEPGRHVEATMMGLCLVCVPFVLQLDSLKRSRHLQQTRELSYGYEGSVRKAACSRPSDHDAIMETIGDEYSAVDDSISVLLTSGGSNAILRKASAAGVNVQKLGYVSMAAPVCTFLLWVHVVSWSLLYGVKQHELAEVIPYLGASLLGPLTLAFVLLKASKENLAFIFAGVIPFASAVVIPIMFVLLLAAYAAEYTCVYTNSPAKYMGLAMNIIGFTSLPLGALGLDGLINMPIIGRSLARMLLGTADSTQPQLRTRLSLDDELALKTIELRCLQTSMETTS